MSDISDRADRFVRSVFKRTAPVTEEQQAAQQQLKQEVDRLTAARLRAIKNRKGY